MKISTASALGFALVVATWIFIITNSPSVSPGQVMAFEMTGAWVLFLIAPAVSPKGFRIERFRRTFDILQVSLLGLFFVFVVLSKATPSAASLRPFAFAAFLMVSGNFMSKITPNFFVGIRTPWTLASDEVWLQTHRFGGKVAIAAGLLIAVLGAFGFKPLWFVGTAVTGLVVSVAYSFVLYRRLEGFKEVSSSAVND